MAKMLSVIDFKDADAARCAAQETGFPVLVGEKVWRSEVDGKNKVVIYTDIPGQDHTPFFEAFKRITGAGQASPASDGATPSEVR